MGSNWTEPLTDYQKRYSKYKATYYRNSRKYILRHPEVNKKNKFDFLSRRDFGGNRKAVFERDKNKCVKCGMTMKKHQEIFGVDLTIDHKDANKKNNDLNNLQTLCRYCHGKKDGARTCEGRRGIWITYKGETHYLAEWARILNIPQGTLYGRYYRKVDPKHLFYLK